MNVIKREPMTAFDWLWELNQACFGFWSNEKPKTRASNSEMRRWFDKSAVMINGVKPKSTDIIESVQSIVLFPKNDNKRISFIFE